MSLHVETMCLHQEAIFRAEKFGLPAAVVAESKGRCFTAATQVCSIMKSIAHMDLSFVSLHSL